MSGGAANKAAKETPKVGKSVRYLTCLFVAYAFLRSVKPFSSYVIHFLKDVNKDFQINFANKINPMATTAQVIFYVFVVLFSSQIGFDVIMLIDCACQLMNLMLTASVHFNRGFSDKYGILVLQIGSFVYGITAACQHTFHSYAFCVFDKTMFQKISGYTRGATTFGHFLGGLTGYTIVKLFSKEEFFIKNLFGIISSKTSGGKFTADDVFSKGVFDQVKKMGTDSMISVYLSLIGITLFFTTATFITQFFFPRLSKEEKEKAKAKASGLGPIIAASSEFKRRDVLLWSLAWCLSFMSMMYSKTWIASCWGINQVRLNEKPLNGLFDCISYFFGAIGSMAPAKIIGWAGYGTTLTIQMILLLVGASVGIVMNFQFQYMEVYYALHIILSFCVYFSMAFQSGELAKCLDHTKIKLIFYMLNFSTFFTQEILNNCIQGLWLQPGIDEVSRYYFFTVFLSLCFMIIFVGFAGKGQSKAHDSEKETPAASPVEQPVVSAKSN